MLVADVGLGLILVAGQQAVFVKNSERGGVVVEDGE